MIRYLLPLALIGFMMFIPARSSVKGINFIKQREGFRDKRYRDEAGLWTIGYGHLIRPGEPYDANYTMSETEATELLKEDLASAENAVRSSVDVPLTPGQFDALVSLAFNIGNNAFRSSTLVKLLNQRDYEGAWRQFDRWNKVTINGEKVVSKGLAKRREMEKQLFAA